MNPNPMMSWRSIAVIALAGLSVGCASTAAREQRLPFHVAILPPVTIADAGIAAADGKASDLTILFDAETLASRLQSNLSQRFFKVSQLTAPAGQDNTDPSVFVGQARSLGADLILWPTLSYSPSVQTSLNDRFWLNLPLFALGGPFGWFVSDRSYYCNARLATELHDVTVAAAAGRQALDASTRVIQVGRESTEASLNFLDRASGMGPYLLSLVMPAGLIASASGTVPRELGTAVTDQLCQALAQSLNDRATEVMRPDLVDFEPRSVRVTGDGAQRFLEGEVVLQLGRVDDLGALRCRFDNGAFVDASFGQEVVEPPSGLRPGRKTYPFRIAVTDPKALFAQVEIEQRDRRASRRTFTYSVAAPKQQ